jgi:hypothetical protein
MFAAATWSMDATALRVTLDALNVALQRPISVIGGDVLGHDRDEISASLKVILERLATMDLTATRAMSGFVREFRSEAQVHGLRDLFAGLQDGWRKRVARILGETKLGVVRRLLTSHSPDVLRILGREDDENSHSDLIAWLLNPRRAPTIAPIALRRLVSCFEDRDEWCRRIDAAIPQELISVRREMMIGRELAASDDLCRVDIVVSGPGFVLAVENKVWSSEHSDQTTTYWQWLDQLDKKTLRGGLFLSPSGLTASSTNFVAVSYLEMVSALLEAPAAGPIMPTEELVLASYLKTLARNILPVEMRAVVAAACEMEGK